MTLSHVVVYIDQTLQSANIESIKAERNLILESLGFSSLDIAINSNYTLNTEQEKNLNIILERRKKREPLQHILGYAYFYGLKLLVTPDVLIPRPETEWLVAIALEMIKDIANPVVLDIGTGSGAIALAIKQQRPEAKVIASDISEKALDIAKQNADMQNLEIDFFQSDLLDSSSLKSIAQECDLIVANLPYLPTSDYNVVSPEVLHDPSLALYSGQDGLELFRKLIVSGKTLKTPQLLFELDPRNVQQAYDDAKDYAKRIIYQDLVGRKRFLGLKTIQ